MKLSVDRVTFSVSVLVLIVCSAEAMNYLAFPRMGRSGYLAFPRMGRAQVKSETVADISSCCGLGLKSEFAISQDGKEELHVICPVNAGCCEGLREVVDEKPDGTYYSLCIPAQSQLNVQSAEAMGKMKSVSRK